MISTLKCIYSFNYHGHRDANINEDMASNECPRYSNPESWDHMVKCKEIAMFRSEFWNKLKQKLVKSKVNPVTENKVQVMITNIRLYLVNVEDMELYETNQ